MKVFITYEVLSEGDAGMGDTDRRGYAIPGGWRFETNEEAEVWLRDALREVHPIVSHHDCGQSFSGEPQPNYQTGDEETLTLHLPRTITESSRRRMVRIMQHHRY